MRYLFASLSIIIYSYTLYSQETFPYTGVKDERNIPYAFKNTTLVISPDKKLENATLLIQKNKIIASGENVEIPEGTVVYDLKGKYIYPSFIDMHTSAGMPAPKKSGNPLATPVQIPPITPGAYNASDAIKAQFNAVEIYNANKKEIEPYRNSGFGTILTFREDGIIRGTSLLVSLLDSSELNEAVVSNRASLQFSFDKGSSKQLFPYSKMGMVAMLRQTLYDAKWYESSAEPGFYDESLQALNNNMSLPKIITAESSQDVSNAGKISKEFNLPIIIKATGQEYKDISSIKNLKIPLIIPLNFPKPYDVSDPFEAEQVSLAKLKEWELAPYNPKYLQDAGIEMALTSFGLKNKSDFIKNLKISINNGLSEANALKALTTTPSYLLGVADKLGTLETGKLANFIITSDNIFTGDGLILENWVMGKRFVIKHNPGDQLFAEYKLKVQEEEYNLTISSKKGKPVFKVLNPDSLNLNANGDYSNNLVSFYFLTDTAQKDKKIRLSGWFSEEGLKGEGQLSDGKWITWEATRVKQNEEKKDKKSDNKSAEAGEIWYPFEAYGRTTLPETKDMLIKNATVWVLEGDEEILKNADVLIKDGKIEKVGKNINAKNIKIIDGTGKHVTPGIIDEHSHIALTSINDIAVNSAMVRMQDVIEPSNIFIYRQLAGGVTTAQLLHGSANPIGGQSAIIKLRWGENADGLLLKDAEPFIKFALGENVKRANSPATTKRYPNTRMGVEQVYEDVFTQAYEYKTRWEKYNQNTNLPKPRKNLALEPLSEILEGKRHITCHSYVQSEINMLMKVAEQHDFKVNTFTHILEGYKVADKMKIHGAGGSTFSDWWAYKFEVYEATAYNAALMTEQGLTVAINSDDAEMARRLNQEAAKSIKYGGMSETEALKMVTLNPAKLLHLEHRLGTIVKGKDADLVIWTDNPLSIYAKPEKTIIEGKIYFDIEEDKTLRQQNAEERNRIIQKMIDAKKQGQSTQPAKPSGYHNFHCDDL